MNAILVVARQPDAEQPPVAIINALRKPDAGHRGRRVWQEKPQRTERRQQEDAGESKAAKDGAEMAHEIGVTEVYGASMSDLSTNAKSGLRGASKELRCPLSAARRRSYSAAAGQTRGLNSSALANQEAARQRVVRPGLRVAAIKPVTVGKESG